MKKRNLLLFASLLINLILICVFAIKMYNNWFEEGVLKLKFRENIFKAAPTRPGLIFFVGDSHTEAFELNEYLTNGLVRNRGVWGDISASVLKRIDEIAVTKPSKIFMMIGVNDIVSGKKPEFVADNVGAIITRIKNISPGTAIYIQSVLPTDTKIDKSQSSSFNNIVKLNALYRDVCTKQSVGFINLFPYFALGHSLNPKFSFDGLHLNGQGYVVWSKLIKGYL